MGYNPWDAGCTACAQEAMIKEYSFQLIKQEAEEYGKEHEIDLVIYMEAQTWKYINAAVAAELGIHHGREIIRFSKHTQPR